MSVRPYNVNTLKAGGKSIRENCGMAQPNRIGMTKEVIDRVYSKIKNVNQISEGMEELFSGLREIRLGSSENEWHEIVRTVLLSHPIKEIIDSDPITHRSFHKPRGYPGDAVLLDMIYFHPSIKFKNVSEVGEKIYEYTSNEMAAKAVRYRKDYLARFIDLLAEKKNKPKVLSVACGHLREVEASNAVKKKALGAYIATDQDSKSIQRVKRDYQQYGVTVLNKSVGDIIKRNFDFKDFDLIYSAGLYDYLDKKVALKLTSRLFELLAGGGVLVFTNFLPGIKAVGYMESYMAWQLIFRDEPQMLELVYDIPRNRIERVEIFAEKEENIAFLLVHKSK